MQRKKKLILTAFLAIFQRFWSQPLPAPAPAQGQQL
jgi:hypothetical protein